jgi:hypothetical protein
MMPDPGARKSGPVEERITSRAERVAAGWQPRFVVDRARVVEMVRLYQELGYETAVDLFRPEHPGDEEPGREAADVGPVDPQCGECRLVTLRWLHVIYTRAPRGR